jgi:hypothetical protein
MKKIGIIIPNINNYIMNNIICKSEHMILNRQIIQREATRFHPIPKLAPPKPIPIQPSFQIGTQFYLGSLKLDQNCPHLTC